MKRNSKPDPVTTPKRLAFLLFGIVAMISLGGPRLAAQCNGFNLLRPTLFRLSAYDAVMRAGDVNTDGVADLISVLPQVHKISVQLGNGEGGILSTTDFPSGSNPTDLELGDFDRDGELDVVVTNGFANQFSFLKGDGQGRFAVIASFPTSSPPNVLEVGNFDSK